MTSELLEKKIREKFKLFSGIHEKEEDEKIHKLIYDSCVKVAVSFFDENLTESQAKQLMSELEQIDEDAADPKSVFDLLSTYFYSIPDAALRLETRIDYHLNDLVKRLATKDQV